jgi:oligopeptide/dipeptide ABC transporter ATP-binding protein
MGLTYLFITHDLSVVKHISNEITVMYLGQSVEWAAAAELFVNHLHPYTQALLHSIHVPHLSARRQKHKVIQGELTSPIDPPLGCRFAARCPHVRPACHQNVPFKECQPGYFCACTLMENV